MKSKGATALIVGGVMLAAILVGGVAGSSIAGRIMKPEEVAGPPILKPGLVPDMPPSPPIITVAVGKPQPLPDRVPTPAVRVPQLPYADQEPHPLPTEAVDVAKVKQALEPAASTWAEPGTFHVNSLWQIDGGLQVASGFFDGVLLPGVIELPADGMPRFYAVPKSGGGGPATIHGVKGDWVLVQTGLGYAVFNYRTGRVDVSDEDANPGRRAVLH